MSITTVTRGTRTGVNRDGKAVGYAVRIRKTGTWTAYVYTAKPPFDYVKPGFTSEDAAVAFIGENGEPR